MRRALGILWWPSLIVLLLWGLLRLDRVLPRAVAPRPWPGAVLVLAGVTLALWCVGLFARFGRGTPHPFAAKTKKLVVRGPYRYVRNPMMWAVGMLLLGSALWMGSTGLLLGFAGFLPGIHLFVTRYEERDMARRFGEEYREYCRRTPRWWPKFNG